jgi:hypothetical protein
VTLHDNIRVLVNHYRSEVNKLPDKDPSNAPSGWNKTVKRDAFVASGLLGQRPDKLTEKQIAAKINADTWLWHVVVFNTGGLAKPFSSKGKRFYEALLLVLDSSPVKNLMFFKSIKEVLSLANAKRKHTVFGEDIVELAIQALEQVRQSSIFHYIDTFVDIYYKKFAVDFLYPWET